MSTTSLLAKTGLLLSSTGMTFGVAFPTMLLALVGLLQRNAWSYIPVLSMCALVSVVFVGAHSATKAVLYILVLGLMFTLSKGYIAKMALQSISQLFWAQCFFFAVGYFSREYIGGVSAGGFNIVNDFSLQLALTALVGVSFHKFSTLHVVIALIICAVNDSKIVFIFLVLGILSLQQLHLRTKIPIILFGVIATLSISGWIIFKVDRALSEEACGSLCFRIWAVADALSVFSEHYGLGIGAGGAQQRLQSFQESGMSFVMSGSYHNFFIELFLEYGLVAVIGVAYVVAKKMYFWRFCVVLLGFSAISISIMSAGLVFLLAGMYMRHN